MSNLLKLAVNANLPIITVKHSDLLHVGLVLKHVLKKQIELAAFGHNHELLKTTATKGKLASCHVFYTVDPEFKLTEVLYNWLVEHEKTLILVNHADTVYSFDAGALTIPDDLIESILKDTIDNATIKAILPALQGLTVKSITELIRITSATDTAITPRAITRNRPLVASQVQGLAMVNKSLPLYFPHDGLKAYIDLNKSYFLSQTTPEQLVPRGILLDGIGGTGKTSAAKYIANEFEVPLYRLDIGASLARFVGDSEANLARALAAVQQEPYCVMLIDEIEKLFGENDDSGVTSRLLAQLLWFLQEHKGRIFTVMTTNNKTKLPPELYRSGRIDEVFTLSTMSIEESIKLAVAVASQFVTVGEEHTKHLKESVIVLQENAVHLTPAAVTNTVYLLIKKRKWV